MESIKQRIKSPEQKLLQTFVCDGCNQHVTQTELIIPSGPREGERVIANYGCRCEDIKLAKAAKQKYNQLKHRNRMDRFNYYSLINESLKEATFDNFDAYDSNLKRAKDKALAYSHSFDRKQNLLLTGDYGTGKSHLSVSITKALMTREYECLFLSLPKLLTKVKGTYNTKGVTEEELLNIIQRVDLLVLDDIGAEQRTEWSTSKLFEILDDRSGKATVYTTNLSSNELKERVSERNFSRMMDNTNVIVINGSDYRRRAF
ncbi:DNA replication protein DnaC [Lentibacillus persicus]|uniref:DNA replication protein DnaC n=1 Tax=Lentibacillus persicus TaxID=640948 RepID=A0A1I2B6A8_9BACI|nr:ATP-binding protein [Lentibacillus persicus]SFE50680.1 DNA replication protein DnaC [Lentibacillus persicus]